MKHQQHDEVAGNRFLEPGTTRHKSKVSQKPRLKTPRNRVVDAPDLNDLVNHPLDRLQSVENPGSEVRATRITQEAEAMTTERQMAMMYAAQQEVIALLDKTGVRCGDPALNAMRRERHRGADWPYSCRSAACVWCRRPTMRGWSSGFCHP
jgi:hypothetical protein